MSRRRKTRGTTLSLLSVDDAINKLEDRMLECIDHPTLSVDDVLRWLFPQETLDILHAAHPFASVWVAAFDSGRIAVTGGNFSLHVNCQQAKIPILVPKDGSEVVQPAYGGEIVKYMAAVREVGLTFNKVRDVVEWMNDKSHAVTVGALRYYWPAALSLVGEGHPIHTMNGEKFREPIGITKIIPALRETSTIIATALLMPEPESSNGGYVSFTFDETLRSFRLVGRA